MGLRITSWNVNGIRNPFAYQPWRENKTYQAMFDSLDADIVVMQETKIQRKDLQDDMVLVPGWDVYFSLPKFKKGYSGVAIYTRTSRCCPIRAEEGITGVLCPPNSDTKFRDLPAHSRIGGYPRPGQLTGDVDEATLDSEGRCVILEFPAFVLIGVYSPATRDETRTDFRLGFQEAMDVRVRNLVAMGKQVVLTGDLNIIRGELDTAGLLDRLRKEDMSLDDFFSMPSRRFLNHLVFDGVVIGERDEGREAPVLHDLCREFHPVRHGMYTCWETRRNARPSNFGSRIDYVLCSAGIRTWFVDAGIQEGLLGSDHCPVYATLSDVVKVKKDIADAAPSDVKVKEKDDIADVMNPDPSDVVKVQEKDVHIADVMNPEGMFRDGERLRDWSTKDLLPLSARLLPDFDRRQSIRDMFSRTPSLSTATSAEPRSHPAQPGEPAQAPDQSAGLCTQTSTHETTPPSSQPSLQKRPPVAHTSSSRPQKKAKSTAGQAPDKSSTSRSQMSLRGFFTPKEPADARPDKGLDAAQPPSPPGGQASLTIPSPHLRILETDPGIGQVDGPDRIPGIGDSTQPEQTDACRASDGVFDPIQPKESKILAKRVAPEQTDTSDSVFDPIQPKESKILKRVAPEPDTSDSVFDPIQSKESWSKILTKRVAPKCEHGEPCISLVTKKPGVNCGRSFYMCGRPLGPSGEKEKGTEWRCGTFIWSSDWGR
ncbi:DNA-(apurinic or apyrimidinic site) lyase 2 [Magnaporthiopsis poae ATCC 64411]|uniref:DNA-(apurinic or apyrimidinic site) endonuclease 2 n=1 Tax=Magnaporthiopsis poae (strain ATCC 64411 / 73-15) TaxID=644358 RepID=A0A0C4EDD5_MAGP6|nr:DNA-(apurinic or apyrimidinic site) lyase 2 [Magnaporthiopsis poae ATCC 64411]